MTDDAYAPFLRAALTVCATSEHAQGAVIELCAFMADRAAVRIHMLRGIRVAPWWRLDLRAGAAGGAPPC